MVKSDKWIAHQSNRPTHVKIDRSGLPGETITSPYSEHDETLIRNWCLENNRDIYGNREFARPIKEEELVNWSPMIEGFFERPVRYVYKDSGLPAYIEVAEGQEAPDNVRRVISYGTSSYGYDVRLSADPEHIKVFTNVFLPEIDPKRMKAENFASPQIKIDETGAKYVHIPAHSYIQAPTMEYFRIPRDVLVIVLGKSTYARSALICNVTPIEPEFEGEVVLEVANVTNSPVRCYLNEGIAQFVFFQSDEECLRSYKDKLGKYMGQRGLTLAKV